MPLIDNGQYTELFYNILKLAVPNTYMWLVVFYCLFHTYLNLFAEGLGFADRNFYSDWWNSESLGEYWRKWNLPVHNFLFRHIYFPLLRRKVSRTVSMLIVFGVSAFFHEYIVGGALGIWNMMAFNAMMGNVPIIIF